MSGRRARMLRQQTYGRKSYKAAKRRYKRTGKMPK